MSHGSGIYVYDTSGKRYLDASGGPAVYCLGHGHPEVTAAIVRQLERIAHGYRYTFTSDPLEQLTEIVRRHCVEPGLRDADILRKRAEQVAEIKAAEEQPGYTANVEFIKALFGDRPYGHPGAGSPESVAKLSTDVKHYSVYILFALVLFTFWLPKLKLLGVSSTPGAPPLTTRVSLMT